MEEDAVWVHSGRRYFVMGTVEYGLLCRCPMKLCYDSLPGMKYRLLS